MKDPSGTSVNSTAQGKLCYRLMEGDHIAASLDNENTYIYKKRSSDNENFL
jgi:hypothetical protein